MRSVVAVGDRDVLVAWDDRPPPEQRFGALVLGRAIDEIDGTALPTTTTLRGDTPGSGSGIGAGVTARDGAFGSFGVVGIAATALRGAPPDDPSRGPPPLRSASYDLRVTATGHLPIDVTLTADPIGAAGLPGPPVTVAMHRLPTTISGTCTVREPSTAPLEEVARYPLADAVVSVVAAYGPPDLEVPDGAPPVGSSAGSPGPRRWARAMEASTVRIPAGAALQRVATDEHQSGSAAGSTRVVRAVAVGDTVVVVESAEGIEIGSIVRVLDGDLTVVVAVRPSLREIVVGEACSRPVPPGADVVVVKVTPEGPPIAVDLAIEPGDRTLLLVAPTDLAVGPDPRFDTVDDVRFTAPTPDGSPIVMYRRVSALTARTDSHGSFRLPPVHRVATLGLRVRHLGVDLEFVGDAATTVELALQPGTQQFVHLTVTTPTT